MRSRLEADIISILSGETIKGGGRAEISSEGKSDRGLFDSAKPSAYSARMVARLGTNKVSSFSQPVYPKPYGTKQNSNPTPPPVPAPTLGPPLLAVSKQQINPLNPFLKPVYGEKIRPIERENVNKQNTDSSDYRKNYQTYNKISDSYNFVEPNSEYSHLNRSIVIDDKVDVDTIFSTGFELSLDFNTKRKRSGEALTTNYFENKSNEKWNSEEEIYPEEMVTISNFSYLPIVSRRVEEAESILLVLYMKSPDTRPNVKKVVNSLYEFGYNWSDKSKKIIWEFLLNYDKFSFEDLYGNSTLLFSSDFPIELQSFLSNNKDLCLRVICDVELALIEVERTIKQWCARQRQVELINTISNQITRKNNSMEINADLYEENTSPGNIISSELLEEFKIYESSLSNFTEEAFGLDEVILKMFKEKRMANDKEMLSLKLDKYYKSTQFSFDERDAESSGDHRQEYTDDGENKFDIESVAGEAFLAVNSDPEEYSALELQAASPSSRPLLNNNPVYSKISVDNLNKYDFGSSISDRVFI